MEPRGGSIEDTLEIPSTLRKTMQRVGFLVILNSSGSHFSDVAMACRSSLEQPRVAGAYFWRRALSSSRF